jgi:hypothetical protein
VRCGAINHFSTTLSVETICIWFGTIDLICVRSSKSNDFPCSSFLQQDIQTKISLFGNTFLIILGIFLMCDVDALQI